MSKWTHTTRVCVCVHTHACAQSTVMSDSLRSHGLWLSSLLCPWKFPGKNTGVGCHFLVQGIFPTQGSNPGLLHCKADALPSEPQGSHLWIKEDHKVSVKLPRWDGVSPKTLLSLSKLTHVAVVRVQFLDGYCPPFLATWVLP